MRTIKPKPWVRRWHVCVLAWVFFFPTAIFGNIKLAFKWSVDETKKEIKQFDFSKGGKDE